MANGGSACRVAERRGLMVRFGTDMGGVEAWEDVIAEVIVQVK